MSRKRQGKLERRAARAHNDQGRARMTAWMRSTEDPEAFRAYVISNADFAANDFNFPFHIDSRTGRRYVCVYSTRVGAESYLADTPERHRRDGDRVFELPLAAFLAWLRVGLDNGHVATFRVENSFEVQARPF